MTNRNATLCILRSFAQNHPVATEHMCDQTLCVLEVLDISIIRSWASEFFHVDRHQRKAQSLAGSEPKAGCPKGVGACGYPDATGVWPDTFSLGMGKKVRKAQLSFVPGASGNRYGGSICTSGARVDAQTRCAGPAAVCLFLLPLPPQASSLLTRLACSPPHQENSSHQVEGGKKEMGLSTPPPDSALCICPGVSLLERTTLLFPWVTQRAALSVRGVFLLHKHTNRI